MDNESIRSISYIIPALVKSTQGITNYFGHICMILELIRPPPNPILNIMHRLFGIVEDTYGGRNVFSLISSHRYQFFKVTGESLETSLDLLDTLRISSYRPHKRSAKNKVLLVLIWFWTNPALMMLSSLFNISVPSVTIEVRLATGSFVVSYERNLEYNP
jgi:hypothetical protein